MSQNVATTDRNIRMLIDDLDRDDYAISSMRMRNIIAGKVRLMAGRLLLPMALPSTSINLAAGTFDYTFSATPNVVRQMVRNSDGMELIPVSFEWMKFLYKQDTAVALPNGVPRYYALYELNTQASKVRFAPTPIAVDAVDVSYDTLPVDGAGDTVSVPFGLVALTALERLCAAECLMTMSDDDRAKRKLSPAVAQSWMKDAEDAIKAENWRQRIMGRTQNGILRGQPPRTTTMWR